MKTAELCTTCPRCSTDIWVNQRSCCIEECIWFKDKEFMPQSSCNCPLHISTKDAEHMPPFNVHPKQQSHICSFKLSRSSLPDILDFKSAANGLTVIARGGIGIRSIFGPIVAPLVLHDANDFMAAFSIPVQGSDTLFDYFMESDEDTNWMKHVSITANKSDANLVAFHTSGCVYFVAVKEIPIGEELRVAYANNFFSGSNTLSENKNTEQLDLSLSFPDDFFDDHGEQSENNRVSPRKRRKPSSTDSDPDFDPFSQLPAKKRNPTSSYQKSPRKTPGSSAAENSIEFSIRYDTGSAPSTKRTKQARKPQKQSEASGPRNPAPSSNTQGDVTVIIGGSVLNEQTVQAVKAAKRAARNTKEKPFKCPTCDRRYVSQDGVRHHRCPNVPQPPKSTTPVMSTCLICQAVFPRYEVERHYDAHRIDGKYPCPVCRVHYDTRDLLVHHHWNVHRRKTKPCELCGFLSEDPKTMRAHRMVHQSELPTFTCDQCSETFTSSKARKWHVERTHVGERVLKRKPRRTIIRRVRREDWQTYFYKCHQCKLGFYMRRGLILHLDTFHPDVAKASIPELNLPLKRGTGYACMVCKKQFVSEDVAKTHVDRNHSPEDLEQALAKLKKKPTEGVMYDGFLRTFESEQHYCEFCDSPFERAKEFLNHTKQQHPEYHQVLMPHVPPDIVYK